MTRITGLTAGRIEAPRGTRATAGFKARAARIAARVAGRVAAAFSSVIDTRQRQIDRQVAHYLAQSGGRLTDDIERRIIAGLHQGGFGPPRS